MSVCVLIGTAKGALILRSDSTRREWSSTGLDLRGWLVTSFTRDVGGRYYAAVAHDVYGSAILTSDDLESWKQLETAPRYGATEKGNESHLRIIGAMDPMGQFKEGGRYVDQIWKLHSAGDTLYAAVSEAGLFRSTDRAKTWQPVSGLNDHETRESWVAGFGGLCAHSILTDARNSDRLWVGISAAGVFRSDDGGRTFEGKNEGINNSGEGFCVHSLAHDPDNADVIFRRDHRGMYRSDNGGDSWQLIETGLPTSELSDGHRCCFGFASAMDPLSQSIFIVPLESDGFRYPHDAKLSVYRTRNAGANWQALRNGLPDDCYANVLRGAMTLDGLDPCGVYFGTTSGSLYASADAGESWKRLASDLPKILCVESFTD
jgi:photosystem II stability/assembly factor-like uncharacterized protein